MGGCRAEVQEEAQTQVGTAKPENDTHGYHYRRVLEPGFSETAQPFPAAEESRTIGAVSSDQKLQW